MNAVAPSVSEGLYLLRFARDVFRLSVLHVWTSGTPLKIAIESYSIWRVYIDTLHLTTQTFAFGETSHHLKRVAEYQPVRPVLLVLVEFGPVDPFRDPVEVRKKIQRCLTAFMLALLRRAQQVVDRSEERRVGKECRSRWS